MHFKNENDVRVSLYGVSYFLPHVSSSVDLIHAVRLWCQKLLLADPHQQHTLHTSVRIFHSSF